MLRRIIIILGVIMTVADMVSDIVLAVDYCVTDNPWWCGLTWTFISIPLIVGIIILFLYKLFDANANWRKINTWKVWKSIEICFESAPQLLLQLYILARTNLDPMATSGKMFYFKVTLKFLYSGVGSPAVCRFKFT